MFQSSMTYIALSRLRTLGGCVAALHERSHGFTISTKVLTEMLMLTNFYQSAITSAMPCCVIVR